MSDQPSSALWLTVILHLVFFFVASMACHGELARRRPQAADLTEFYLFISIGGVIGGIFAGLLAPVIFSTVLEYPILIAASLFCLPALYARSWRINAREALIAAAVVAVLATPDLLGYSIRDLPIAVYQVALGLAALAIILLRYRPAANIAAVVGAMVLSVLYVGNIAGSESYRSFFGVNKIAVVVDGQFRTLTHGTTLHGAQRIRNADGSSPTGKPEPSTYYYPGSPMDEAITETRRALGNIRVAIIGLGTGSLACHAEPGEDWRFYEIDREVEWIAKHRFRFLSECAPGAPVVIGDARLTLAHEPAGRFDVILIDAFSSDAIPVHLLTREAIASYMEKLSPHGVLIFHLSNRHMDLRPVLANAAAANGLATVAKRVLVDQESVLRLHTSSSVAAVARSNADLAQLTKAGWEARRPTTARVWTDDYSNVLGAVLAGWRSSD
jgi:spermidine synthase